MKRVRQKVMDARARTDASLGSERGGATASDGTTAGAPTGVTDALVQQECQLVDAAGQADKEQDVGDGEVERLRRVTDNQLAVERDMTDVAISTVDDARNALLLSLSDGAARRPTESEGLGAETKEGIEPLRVLIVEDSKRDFELMVTALKIGIGQGIFRRVTSAEAMRSALAEASWDAVISDWSLPTFSATAALSLLSEMGLDVPFIIVSGAVGEEAAVAAIRAGARDYVLKDNLARLLPTVRHELRDRRVRESRREVDRVLAERTANLASLNADLESTQHSLRQALQSRDDFLSVASHELRTPLTTLKLQVESLIRHRTSDAASIAAQLNSIDRQANRLTALITQLLDVSRIAENRLRLEVADMDLTDLVEDVAARFDFDLKQSGSELRVRVEPTRGLWDRERVDQVLTNLLTNAIKFGNGGLIEVIVEPTEGGARLCVRDHGMGIEPNSLSRIFERFERGVSARNFGGLGLGLWIVRQIVQACEGTVSVESEVGRGSVFVVELPSAPKTTAVLSVAPTEASILVIDDDADIRDAMKLVLEAEGYRVAVFGGGADALSYLRSHSTPSLILLDLTMPEMDGYEFRHRQMADPKLSQIPVVVATGAGKNLRTCELGGAAVLTKPVDLDTLLAAIKVHRAPRSGRVVAERMAAH